MSQGLVRIRQNRHQEMRIRAWQLRVHLLVCSSLPLNRKEKQQHPREKVFRIREQVQQQVGSSQLHLKRKHSLRTQRRKSIW